MVRTKWKHFFPRDFLFLGQLGRTYTFPFSYWTEPAVPNGVCDASGRSRHHQQPYWTLRASGRVHQQDFRNFHPPVPGSTASLQVLCPWTCFLFNHFTAIHIANYSCIRQYRCNVSRYYLWNLCPVLSSDIILVPYGMCLFRSISIDYLLMFFFSPCSSASAFMSYIGIDRPPVEQGSPDAPVLDQVRVKTFKGTMLRDFDSRFFSLIGFPQAPEWTLMLFSGVWGKMIHERNLKQKISGHCPFKRARYSRRTFGERRITLCEVTLCIRIRTENFGIRIWPGRVFQNSNFLWQIFSFMTEKFSS